MNFIFSDHAMGPIPEEMIAFDNQAYHSLNLDSGFDSSPSSYENVPRSIDTSEEPSYENIDEDLEALSYENIEPPLTYQNKSLEENRLPSCQFEEYENLKFQQKTEIGPIPPPPPNTTLPQKGANSNLKDSPKPVHKAIPVYATCKKTPKITLAETEDEADDFEEESPVYENYDFQVQLICFAIRSNYFPQKLHGFNFLVKFFVCE